MAEPGETDAPPTNDAASSAASPSAESASPSPVRFVREHPWITVIMAACTIGGAVAGPIYFDEAWPLARQIGAGAFLGAWIGLTITVTKMIG